MKIAVVGTGIAGNVAAYHLSHRHEVTVFEASDHVGGHTNTVDVLWRGRRYAVDTGFIVFNDWTYPKFIALLDTLGVESQPTTMSFSVRCERSGLEYNGTSLNALFAQRRNLLRPAFHRMIADILRFNREAPLLLASPDDGMRLGDYLAAGRYARQFIDHYIVPMGSAIWSADPQRLLEFPARFFIRFFHNHGMLSVNRRPQWRVVKGGSRAYVAKLIAPFADRIRLRTPVEWIRRLPDGIELKARHQAPAYFDRVFLACHSDQALRLLADASEGERTVLGAIAYQENEAVLHTDESLLPKRRLAWAAWNYHIRRPGDAGPAPAAVTYNMNMLQGLKAPVQFCVTLNHREAIDPRRIIRTITYHHPVFNTAAEAAQARQGQLNGSRHTYFCGAYWRYGFHEDGVVSALAALQHFSEREHVEERHLRRAG